MLWTWWTGWTQEAIVIEGLGRGRYRLMQSQLTAKQQRLLACFRVHIEKTGAAPSLREAAREMGISHTAVAQTLKILEKKGLVRREGRYGRSVYLVDGGRQTSGLHRWRDVPVIGRITAGLPLYAQQEWDGSIVVDAAFYRGDNLFALSVRGDSMAGAGILDGDLAICEPRQYAENGEIVVALVGGEEATVKRFFAYADHILLKAENTAYAPVRYGFGEILVQGKVIGIQRGPDVMQRL